MSRLHNLTVKAILLPGTDMSDTVSVKVAFKYGVTIFSNIGCTIIAHKSTASHHSTRCTSGSLIERSCITDKDEVYRSAQGACHAVGDGGLYVRDLRHYSNPSYSEGARTGCQIPYKPASQYTATL